MSTKVAAIVTLPVVCIMTFYSYSEYRADERRLFRNTEMQLLRIAESIKGPLEFFLAKMNTVELQTTVVDASKGMDIELMALYDPKGGVMASNKEKWLGKTVNDMHPEDVTTYDLAAVKRGLEGKYSIYFDPEDVQYCMVMPLSYGSAADAALHVSMDVGTLKSELEKDAVRNVILSILLSFIIGATIYFLFHYLFTRRIKAVSESAVKFASGDMTTRVNATGTDEIGNLATSFNLMAEEITNWRTNLENMVVQRVKDLSILYEVVDAVSKSLELGKVLPSVLDRVLENMGERKGIVVVIGEEGDTLKVMGQRGLSHESIRQISNLGHGCAGDVVLKNRPLRIAAGDDREMKELPGLESENVRSALVVPISSATGALGAIAVYSEEKDKFSEQDEALLATIGSQVGVAVENARLYEKTLELANRDGLTGLATRRFMMETLGREIQRSARYSAPLSLLLLDLDKFKRFNDTYGHLRGDDLLKEFASLVQRQIRTSDMAGRYGGEEFVIILPNTPLKGAIVTAERIRKSFEAVRISVADGSSQAGTTVSIGIAELSPGEAEEKIISAADAALYRAKEAGRNRAAW